jgi:hypothetical protein
MQHADFGHVSMQFTARDQGLAVTMRSADPGFAPAAAAAASSGSASAGDSQTGTGHGNAHGYPSDQPSATLPSQTGSARSSSPSDLAARSDPAHQNAGHSANQNTGQDARQQPSRPSQANPTSAAQSVSDADDDFGIFA